MQTLARNRAEGASVADFGDRYAYCSRSVRPVTRVRTLFTDFGVDSSNSGFSVAAFPLTMSAQAINLQSSARFIRKCQRRAFDVVSRCGGAAVPSVPLYAAHAAPPLDVNGCVPTNPQLACAHGPGHGKFMRSKARAFAGAQRGMSHAL